MTDVGDHNAVTLQPYPLILLQILQVSIVSKPGIICIAFDQLLTQIQYSLRGNDSVTCRLNQEWEMQAEVAQQELRQQV